MFHHQGKREGTMVETIEVDVREHMEVQLTFNLARKVQPLRRLLRRYERGSCRFGVRELRRAGRNHPVGLRRSGHGCRRALVGIGHGDATNVENADVNRMARWSISRTDAGL